MKFEQSGRIHFYLENREPHPKIGRVSMFYILFCICFIRYKVLVFMAVKISTFLLIIIGLNGLMNQWAIKTNKNIFYKNKNMFHKRSTREQNTFQPIAERIAIFSGVFSVSVNRKKIDLHRVQRYGHTFRFLYNVNCIFEKNFRHACSKELELSMESASNMKALFLDLEVRIGNKKFKWDDVSFLNLR